MPCMMHSEQHNEPNYEGECPRESEWPFEGMCIKWLQLIFLLLPVAEPCGGVMQQSMEQGGCGLLD